MKKIEGADKTTAKEEKSRTRRRLALFIGDKLQLSLNKLICFCLFSNRLFHPKSFIFICTSRKKSYYYL